MNSEYNIETAIGLFDVAISHSSDTQKLSQTLFKYASAYGLTCYSYIDKQIDQLGLDINEVMKFVYSKTSRFIVINSPLYLKTDATRLEYYLISGTDRPKSIAIFEMGGGDLSFSSCHSVQVIEKPDDFDVIQVIRGWKKSLFRENG